MSVWVKHSRKTQLRRLSSCERRRSTRGRKKPSSPRLACAIIGGRTASTSCSCYRVFSVRCFCLVVSLFLCMLRFSICLLRLLGRVCTGRQDLRHDLVNQKREKSENEQAGLQKSTTCLMPRCRFLTFHQKPSLSTAKKNFSRSSTISSDPGSRTNIYIYIHICTYICQNSKS